jgi:uncharacterized integral membrane protein
MALAVLILTLAALVVVFTLENHQPVSLLIFGWSTSQMPVAGFIILALLLGLVAGPLVAWLIGFRFKRHL